MGICKSQRHTDGLPLGSGPKRKAVRQLCRQERYTSRQTIQIMECDGLSHSTGFDC